MAVHPDLHTSSEPSAGAGRWSTPQGREQTEFTLAQIDGARPELVGLVPRAGRRPAMLPVALYMADTFSYNYFT